MRPQPHHTKEQVAPEALPCLLAVAWDCIIGNKVEERLDVGEIVVPCCYAKMNSALHTSTVHNLYLPPKKGIPTIFPLLG